MEEDRLRAVWEHELSRLEVDVVRIERLARTFETGAPEPWNPPQVPGPMPEDLIPRAQELLDRQAAAREAVTAALADARGQLSLTERVFRATGSEDRPIYLDIEA